MLTVNDLLENIPGMYYHVDCNSKFTLLNHTASEWFGHNLNYSLLGESYEKIVAPVAEQSDFFKAQDQEILNTGKPMKIMAYHCFHRGIYRLVLGEKKLLLSSKGDVLGLVGHFLEVPINDANRQIVDVIRYDVACDENKGINGTYYFHQPNDDSIFTDRQMQVLFYLLRGYSCREVSERLNRSPRTIEKHVEVMKEKLGCRSLGQFIEQCINMGYLSVMPVAVAS